MSNNYAECNDLQLPIDPRATKVGIRPNTKHDVPARYALAEILYLIGATEQVEFRVNGNLSATEISELRKFARHWSPRNPRNVGGVSEEPEAPAKSTQI